MITLLRKIRKGLLNENNFSKYLLYAIGEILLVVIGILIALQINIWNQGRNQQAKERKILTEMQQDLHSNIQHFEKQLNQQQWIFGNINVLIDQIEKDLPFHDSLGRKYSSVSWNEEINFANSAYEVASNIGIDIIQNDSLRRAVVELFNVSYPLIKRRINEVGMAEYTSLTTPVYLDHVRFDTAGIAAIYNYQELKQDPRVINMLSTRRYWKKSVIDFLKGLIRESKQLMAMIEKELDD